MIKNNMIRVAVVGQPNVGKSMLINSLSNSNLKVGNFSGVTVEKIEARTVFNGFEIVFIDLPGSYSLKDYTIDEKVTTQFLDSDEYDIILNVVDSTQLEKNLYLTSQLLELNKKMVLTLNIIDDSEARGIFIDSIQLSKLLGIRIEKSSAKTGQGKDDILNSLILSARENFIKSKLQFSQPIEEELENISNFLVSINRDGSRGESLKLLRGKKIDRELAPILVSASKHLEVHYANLSIDEIFSEERIAIANGIAREVEKRAITKNRNLTERIDEVLIHQLYGLPIFLFLMWILFQITFELGSIPMDFIDSVVASFGEYIGNYILNDEIRSLVVDGIISGVGAVLLFLPNILILFFGISLLETTGYMSRVAFLLDGFFHRFGLHGKSFIPLVTGFGCSIPAYMSARTLKSERDRLITMFIIGFMSCGAKLPVYVLFISAFFSSSEAGNILFGLYLIGAILGLIGAKILRKFIFKGEDEPFIMELPTYRLPTLKLVWHTIYIQALMYLKKAGTFILVASILIWFASNYPKIETANLIENNISNTEIKKFELENSYLGLAGKIVQPVFEPLGFDWQLTVSLFTGIAAKEVVVATLGVLYSVGDEVDETSESLIQKLQESIPLATAMAFLIFIMIYMPCFAASIVFVRETGKKIYYLYLLVFTTIAAYISAFITYLIFTKI